MMIELIKHFRKNLEMKVLFELSAGFILKKAISFCFYFFNINLFDPITLIQPAITLLSI